MEVTLEDHAFSALRSLSVFEVAMFYFDLEIIFLNVLMIY